MVPALALLPVLLVTAVPPAGGGVAARAALVRPGPAAYAGGFAALRGGSSPALRVAIERSAVAATGPAACLVPDACPSRVDIPGQPASSFRAHRSELVLALLARSPIEPVASIASRIAALNLRVSYLPARRGVDPGGWGQILVSLRWKLDATGPASAGSGR